jgi:transcriptional regulator with XRE-family HTH domain
VQSEILKGVKGAMDNRSERQDQAERLRQARTKAGFKTIREAADALGINIETYKAHEAGRNGFGIADAKLYAKRFRVPVAWLLIGDDNAESVPMEEETLTIPEAKRRLARALGVPLSSIKITIEA